MTEKGQIRPTREIFKAIELCSDMPKNIHLDSCYGGNAIADASFLKPGSLLCCYASEDEISEGSKSDLSDFRVKSKPELLDDMIYSFGSDLANNARFVAVKDGGELEVAKYDVNLRDILHTRNLPLTVADDCSRILSTIAPHTHKDILGREAGTISDIRALERHILDMDKSGRTKGFLARNKELIIDRGLKYQVHRLCKEVARHPEYYLEKLKREGKTRDLFFLTREDIATIDTSKNTLLSQINAYFRESIVNLRNSEGNANISNVKKLHRDIVDDFVDKGLNVDVGDGISCFDLAINTGSTKMLDLLIKCN